MSEKNSYAQILKSTLLMGGAAGFTLLFGMVRTKFAAVLIGTVGVGLLANFTAIQNLVGTLAGLGIQSSAVREIAVDSGKGDEAAVGKTVVALRRICWLTGLAGFLAMVAFSPFISQITFGNDQYTLDMAALGVIILLANLSGGQMALLQGTRRIHEMARVNMVSALLTTLISIGFYAWLGLRGIIPALVCGAFLQLALSWRFARRIPVAAVSLDWRQSLDAAGGMVRLGLVFMWNNLLCSAVAYLTVALISQQMGMQAVGLYSAAFSLSGIFVNFVLNAMGADYYPRLLALGHDKPAINRLVNEQTEIGILLAIPGLLATLTLAPWIIRIFYSSEFIPAVKLLQWFTLGCFGRVLSWPLGFVMLALGKGKWFFMTETAANIFHIVLIAFAIPIFGLLGVAMAFPLLYVVYTLAVWMAARQLAIFQWSPASFKLGGLGLLMLLIVFAVCEMFSLWAATLLGILATLMASFYCLSHLTRRIGAEHRLIRVIRRIPFMKSVHTS